jgi:GNAT superfamily N-acetyltransferase
MTPHDFIRSNNIIWWLMYYDELEEHAHCQLSCLVPADLGFYNCAHAVTRLEPADLDYIEKLYERRGVPPAFYVDPLNEGWLPERLRSAGYAEVPEEGEEFHARELRIPVPPPGLRLEPERVAVQAALPGSPAFASFMAINCEANHQPPDIVAKLSRRLVERRRADATNTLLLGTVDAAPAFVGAVGLCAGVACISEAGTRPEYRRLGLFAHMLCELVRLAATAGAQTAVFTCAPGADSGRIAASAGFHLAFRRRYFRKQG